MTMDEFILKYQCSVGIVILAIAMVLTRYRCASMQETLQCPKWIAWPIVIFLWIGALSFWTWIGYYWVSFAMLTDHGKLFDILNSEANLKGFLTRNQVTLLSLVVALAAYTSSVEQKLREKIKGGRVSGQEISYHQVNLQWMYRTDIILVFSGMMLVVRIGRWSLGYQDDIADKLIVAVLGWIITYFSANHIRQMVIAILRPLIKRDVVKQCARESDSQVENDAKEIIDTILQKQVPPKTARAIIQRVSREFE